MIGYTLKHVLELVPEALPLVKRASLAQEYPVDNKDSCIASALVMAYHSKQGRFTGSDSMEKVATAVQAYGVDEDVERLTRLIHVRDGLFKAASVKGEEDKQSLKNAESELSNGVFGVKDVQGLTKQASEIYERSQELGEQPSELAQLYSANAYLVKSAALDALNVRFHLTQDSTFVKIAAALSSQPDVMPPGPLVKRLCEVVSGMDKKAHLEQKGLDFYKETLVLEKQAASAIRVKIGKEEFPVESLQRIPHHHISNYLGADFCKEMNSDPMTAKAVVESLPADSQQILLQVMKSA